jgi:hypothetical protein
MVAGGVRYNKSHSSEVILRTCFQGYAAACTLHEESHCIFEVSGVD